MSSAPERLFIEGQAGALEAIVEETAVAGSRYAIVCHPHPLFGGTMDNKVVTTVTRALHDTGISTVRFNFRGVGSSAGEYGQGVGETADADAVASWGAQRWARQGFGDCGIFRSAPTWRCAWRNRGCRGT